MRGSAAGLTSAEAAARLLRHGPNVLRPVRRRALAVEFLSRFRNPLALLLLAASAVSAATGDVTSFLIISMMVLLSVTLDFVQEHRAGQAAERLKQSVAVRVSVLRDGHPVDRPVADVVPGDVVLLSAGDLVPADGRLVEATDCFVNQALLTGEPYPVERRTGSAPSDPEATVFMGTSVVSGSARMLVSATGPGTVLGGVSESITRRAPPSAFEEGTRSFGLLIMRLTLLLALFVILVNAFFHRPWLESFLFAVALAVGLTPELLPMVVSVTLARGAIRMAAKKVIVKRLAAIHDLGSMDVLCTDKTGTLTEARIRLERHVDAQGRDNARVLQLAYLNSSFQTGLRNPLDEAILRHEDVDVDGWSKVDEVPFDFQRRRVSVLLDDGRQRLLVVKGAPEHLLPLCMQFREGDKPEDLRPLDEAVRRDLGRRSEELGQEGFRVLAIASRDVPRSHAHAVIGDEASLVFDGFAAFLDPPKASAAQALRDLQASGVEVKIVTGDNAHVTRYVCGELGLPVKGILSGTEIAAMDDAALAARVEAATLFCRVNPAEKSRILLALKRRGHVVGYLGDGINDAPSLHVADASLSVEGAVDVAKAAADMILLEPDLRVLHDGVEEGRRTFGNIMKYVMMGTSSNFGNMFSMAGAVLVLPFLPMLPGQILLNNFLYDLSEIAIPMDAVDAQDLARPRRWDMASIQRFMMTVGPVSSAFDFLTFYVMLSVFHAGQALFRTGWFIESLATQVLVIFVIRTRGNPLRSRPHWALTASSLAVMAVAALLPYSRLGARFQLVPLPAGFFAILAGMVLAYLLLVEGVKRWFFRRFAS
jgi:Mg2+-importing ATPase